MRQKPPKVPPSPNLAGPALTGPMVPEGSYTIKLVKDKDTYTGQIKVIADPRSPHSAADRALQQQTLWKLYQMQERLAFVDAVVTDLRDKAKARAGKLDEKDPARGDVQAFADRLDALHKTLVATKEGQVTGEEQLRERIVDVYGWVSQYGGRPSESQLARLPVLEREIDAKNTEFEAFVGKQLADINAKLAAKKLDAIKLLTKEEYDKKQEK